MLAAATDVSRLHHHPPRQFPLYAEIPLVDRWKLHVRGEDRDRWRIRIQLLYWRQLRQWSDGWRRQLCWESSRDGVTQRCKRRAAAVALWNCGESLRGRRKRAGAALPFPGNCAGYRSHLERRDSVERNSIPKANNALTAIAEDGMQKP